MVAFSILSVMFKLNGCTTGPVETSAVNETPAIGIRSKRLSFISEERGWRD